MLILVTYNYLPPLNARTCIYGHGHYGMVVSNPILYGDVKRSGRILPIDSYWLTNKFIIQNANFHDIFDIFNTVRCTHISTLVKNPEASYYIYCNGSNSYS